MLNNFSLYKLPIIFLLVILFPLIQNQWQNLYLFDQSNFSFYKILFSLSGLLFPTIVCLNSFNKFTHYNFSSKSLKNKFVIKGIFLLLFVLLFLIIFTKVLIDYILINIDFVFQIFFNFNNNLNLEFDKIFIFMFTISILLIVKKTNKFLKKIILLNFFICSLFIWFLQTNKLFKVDNFLINNYLNTDNLYLINIAFICLLEIMFYFWSYISNTTNLSDWVVPIPNFSIFLPIYRIISFYLLILIYYLIL